VKYPLFKVVCELDIATHYVRDCLERGYLGEGPRVASLERMLTERFGQPTVLVSSGTAALQLAYYMSGFTGGYVITTPLTCLATNMALVNGGAKLLWADVDPTTGMLDVLSVLRLIARYGTQVKGVVHVDWGGDIGPLHGLAALCDECQIPLIEDAAHAFDAYGETEGDAVGVAHARAFSFQAIKHLTTGDGGAVCFRTEELAQRARLLRWFGLDRTQGASMRCYQDVPESGFKLQMNDIAASIGLAQLPVVGQRIGKQRSYAQTYDGIFLGSKVVPLVKQRGSACWLYTVKVPNAQAFMQAMAVEGVECSQVHARNDTQTRAFGPRQEALPGMDELERTMVCLPVGHWMSYTDIAVIGSIAIRVAEKL
jgi:dTDP-4-amino-4,6-dideoxygalactose transaminase